MYKRSMLRGYDKITEGILAKQLGIPLSHKKKSMRRRKEMAKSMKVGGGGRFAAFKRRIENKGYSASASEDIAAKAGEKKYGKKGMAKLSAMGRRRAAKNDHDGDE